MQTEVFSVPASAGKPPKFGESLADAKHGGSIHPKSYYGRAARWRETDQSATVGPTEMISPTFLTWMEQWHRFFGLRIAGVRPSRFFQ